MSYSRNDILDYIKEDDVKFIRLAFTDPLGKRKNLSIMPNELKEVFDKGLYIDGKNIFYLEADEYKKLLLIPDLDTISVLPWRPSQGRVVRLICNIKDGKEYYKCDARKILMDICSDLENQKLDFKFQMKADFYLLKLDEEGLKTNIPYDEAGYMDVAPLDKGENVRREICLSLSEMGIKPIISHHKMGPGQNVIICEQQNPLTAADNAIAFTTVVKNLSARNGLFADFSYRPLASEKNNSCLIEIECPKVSIDKYYNNLTNHYSEIELFLKPNKDLYDKLFALRLDDNKIIVETTINDVNPYIVTSLVLKAMFDDSKANNKINENIEEAINTAKNSSLVNSVIPEELSSYYYLLK
ncbi:MAG: glutamine synthetase beta-grasp domain-containing protein [Acholeplasmatales bacterium]|nr:glutamine synthetase beta-grasp domain-containing protein [Acholeplasmatales bacterium]